MCVASVEFVVASGAVAVVVVVVHLLVGGIVVVVAAGFGLVVDLHCFVVPDFAVLHFVLSVFAPVSFPVRSGFAARRMDIFLRGF